MARGKPLLPWICADPQAAEAGLFAMPQGYHANAVFCPVFRRFLCLFERFSAESHHFSASGAEGRGNPPFCDGAEARDLIILSSFSHHDLSIVLASYGHALSTIWTCCCSAAEPLADLQFIRTNNEHRPDFSTAGQGKSALLLPTLGGFADFIAPLHDQLLLFGAELDIA